MLHFCLSEINGNWPRVVSHQVEARPDALVAVPAVGGVTLLGGAGRSQQHQQKRQLGGHRRAHFDQCCYVGIFV